MVFILNFNKDGFIDLIPQNGWVYNSTNDSNNPNWVPIVFLNNGVSFNPSTIFYPENDKNSSELYTWNGGMGGFKFPIDIDDDGVIELLQIRFGGIDLIEFSFDNDNDGVINQNDANQ